MAEVSSIQITSTPGEPPAATPPADPNRPAWLPENFTKPEDLAASYKQLQAELTTLKQGAKPAATPPAADPAKPATPADLNVAKTPEEAAAQATAAAGLNMAELEAEVTSTGKLSDARYAALEKAGIPKAMVDEFIQHRVEANSRFVGSLMTEAGGEQQFKSMAEWAKSSYTPEQLAAYNKAIDSGDKGQMQLAVKGLRADYERVKGVQPNLLKGATSAPGAVGEVYQSFAQLMTDQADPRYKTDPAFRAAVKAKLDRSNI